MYIDPTITLYEMSDTHAYTIIGFDSYFDGYWTEVHSIIMGIRYSQQAYMLFNCSRDPVMQSLCIKLSNDTFAKYVNIQRAIY